MCACLQALFYELQAFLLKICAFLFVGEKNPLEIQIPFDVLGTFPGEAQSHPCRAQAGQGLGTSGGDQGTRVRAVTGAGCKANDSGCLLESSFAPTCALREFGLSI